MERFHLSLNNPTNTRLLTNLVNVFFELFKKDESEAVEFLKEEGINIDEFDKENELFMRKLEAEHEKKHADPESQQSPQDIQITEKFRLGERRLRLQNPRIQSTG